MARFSFMCVYLLLPIFAICQFLKKEMFLYIGIARHQYFKGKTVRKEFSYKKPLQNFFKEMHFFFFFFFCFPLLPSLTFWRYSSVGIVGEYPLWGLSVHKHLLSDITGKMQQAFRTVWEPWNPIRESSLWPSPWLMAVFLSVAEAVGSISINCTSLCKAALSYYKLKGKGM